MASHSLVFAASILFAVLPCQSQPSIDYHQHLLSPSAAKLGSSLPKPLTARDLIFLLDAAGVRRALVLSLAYQYGNPNKAPVPDEYAQVQRENDWTAGQVAKYPDRLRAFCGVDPLKSYAVSEIERCAKNPYLHYGLKLHFGNSDVDMDNPSHVAQLRRVFRAADEHRMAIVVHMRSSVTRNRPYGAKEASTFLNPMYQFRLHILLALVDSTIRRLTAPFPSLLMPSPDMMFEWQTSISTSVESRESGDGRRKEP
jgi:predicted TIM-barrel fold metal-dependent hydrolase